MSLHVPTKDHSEAACWSERSVPELRLSTAGRGTLQLSSETLRSEHESAGADTEASAGMAYLLGLPYNALRHLSDTTIAHQIRCRRICSLLGIRHRE